MARRRFTIFAVLLALLLPMVDKPLDDVIAGVVRSVTGTGAADGSPFVTAYRPRGQVAALWEAPEPEVVISGPAGTGKTRGDLELVNSILWRYPKSRALVVRKTRASLTESGLVTYERDVMGLDNPIVAGVQRAYRHSYPYPNGSELIVGGMDRPSRIMSTEYDIILVLEAIELTIDDWESLSTRYGRGIGLPPEMQKMIADTNPGPPTHFLKSRCDRGDARMLYSTHEDNPTLWDAERGEWTPRGKVYISKLDKLTGARYFRLRLGQWKAAEGLVYADWDEKIHLIDYGPIPINWRRIIVLDFGFTNPFVAQWWAIDPDGRMVMYREIYFTQRLVEDHARRAKFLSQDERIEAVIGDHDAEGRATFEKYTGWEVLPADKAVLNGIQAVQARLKVAGDGRVRLQIMRDALDERDPELEDAKKPTSTMQEITSYVYPKGADGKPTKEEPVKVDDHGMDTMRYAVRYVDGAGPSSIAVGRSVGLYGRR
jgi:PBSX family phage terminase large subunit